MFYTSCMASLIALFVILHFAKYLTYVDTKSDFIFRFQSRNVSFNELKRKRNSTFDWTPDVCDWKMQSSLSCSSWKCRSHDRVAFQKPACYCDPLCREVGDCCYNYIEGCTPLKYWDDAEPRDPPKSCIDLNLNYKNLGYVLISGCARNASGGDSEIARRCRAGGRASDIISSIPVIDMRTNASYQNVYCAMCNNATHIEYWNFQINCDKNVPHLVNDTDALMEYAKRNCSRQYHPSIARQKKHSQYCKIKSTACRPTKSQSQGQGDDNLLYRLCNMYILPLYKKERYARNPHCAVCRNITYTMDCSKTSVWETPPALTILFDFKSSSKYRYSVYSLDGEWQRTTYKDTSESFSCDEGFAFDPLERKCKELPKTYETIPFVKNGTNGTNGTNATSSSNDTTSYFQGTNCSLLMYNNSQVTFLPNGSIFVPSAKEQYANGSYTVKSSHVIVCHRNSKTQSKIIILQTASSPFALQILTYVGLSTSILSEIILLAIYSHFKDLRNTPGRNLMCLLVSLVVYQVLFLLSGFNDIRGLCVAMAILLHYFILTSFSWMAVMAYDVMKTFASKGTTLAGFSFRVFLKYCCFAFGLPLTIVLTTLTLDLTGTADVGYGSKYCWISNTLSVIFVMHIPIGLVILFNIVALIITIVAIERTKKSTRMARIDSGVHSPTLCAKLVVVLGITWLLGLVSGYANQAVVMRYIYVILNSFQGFFILVAYATNKRTIKLIKDKYFAKQAPMTNLSKTGHGSLTNDEMTMST